MDLRCYHKHILRWNACAEMEHQHGSWRQPFYDRRNPSMENASLIEREYWIFPTSGSHYPQEITIMPIYTITEAPRRSWRPRKRSRPPQENNKVIEDPKIRSRPQTGAHISINTWLAHFIWTVKQFSFLQCAQGSCSCSCVISLYLGFGYLGECATLGEALDWLFLVILLRS